MSTNSTATDEKTVTELWAQDALYYRDILRELSDMGADIARMVHAQITAQREAALDAQDPAGGPTPEVIIAFDRIARTVRRTSVLARKIAEPMPARGAHPVLDRAAARRVIVRRVGDAIKRDAPAEAAESLKAELLERLDAPEIEDDIGQRPIGDIIVEICRDLGLETLQGFDFWERRTPADVAALCALAARPRGAVGRGLGEDASGLGGRMPPPAPGEAVGRERR